MKALQKVLVATSVGALMAVAGTSAAMATPVFTVNAASIGGGGISFNASDFQYTSNATVIQTAPGVQNETGYAYVTQFLNNGVGVPTLATHVEAPMDYGSHTGTPGTGGWYGLYFTFQAQVSGINGFAGGIGNVDSFTFSMYADKNEDTTFGTPTFAGTTIGGNTGDDILLAHGTLVTGSGGFQIATGAPTFATTDNFFVDDALYFTNPVPFYDLVLTSTTTASASNVTPNCDPIAVPGCAATATAATINGIAGAANFVPEPLTLSVFGAGLVGAAALRRRKSKKA